MIRNCPYCGKEFIKSLQRRKYCSIDCQVKFRRRLAKVKAGDRKSEKIRRDTLSDSMVKKAIYIGLKRKITYDQITSEMIIEKRTCLLVYRKRQEERKANPPKPRDKTRVCIICGKIYKVKGASLFCSKECRNRDSKNKYYANRETTRERRKANWIQPEAFKCKYCGIMHTPKFGEKARSYCSTTCAERARRLLGLFSNSRFRRDRAERNGDKFNVQEIYERDRWKCGICFKKVNKNLKYPNPMSASLDHIVPLALGGTHTRDNVQLAHLKCNIAIGIEGTKQLRLHG